MGLMDILQNALQGNPSLSHEHVDAVTQAAPPADVGSGLAAAMRSDQTPPFAEMVGQLFGRSDPGQQAGMLNQILASLGPAALSGVAGGVLGKLLAPGQTQLTPTQASQVTPAQASEIAEHAQKAQPEVVDQLAQFYAQHAGLIKTLGSAALMIMLARIKENASRR